MAGDPGSSAGEDRVGESLSVIFKRLIANYGPISLQHYMGESNARYYAAQRSAGSGRGLRHRP